MGSAGRLGQIQILFDYITSFKLADNLPNFLARDAVLTTLDRGLLTYFDSIIKKTGSTIDYLYGETILQGFGTMIPRFIYPNKSDMNITHWTAHRYGELSPNDEVTNVAPTYMGEFYMNFGFSGVLFGMFFVGMLASIVDKYVIGDRRSWTLPIMMFMILWQESVLGHTLFGFIKELIFLVPAFLFIDRALRKPLFRHT